MNKTKIVQVKFNQRSYKIEEANIGETKTDEAIAFDSTFSLDRSSLHT